MEIFGKVLQKQVESNDPIFHVIERDDHYISVSNTQMYFSRANEWPEIELKYLNKVKSPVLDVGCGAGRHSLYLQEQGHEVTSMDIDSSILEVCKQRGLKRTVLGSVHDLPKFQKSFKSILLLGANVSLGGTLKGMVEMFTNFYNITTDDAIIIGNYTDLETDDPVHIQYQRKNKKKGLPRGQIRIRIRYEKSKSNWFNWFIPSEEEFQDILEKSGWKLRNYDTGQKVRYVVLEKQD